MASTSIIFDLIGRDRASKDFDKVGSSAEKSGGKLAKMGKLGKMAGLGLAAGAGAAAVGLFKLAQGAAEDEAGQKRLAKAMQNAAGASKGQVAATEDWITAQGKALGVADDDLRPALQKLVGATHDVGKAQKLAALAMDASAGSGMSLEATSKILARAQNGNVSGMAKLGISVKNAKGETVSFAEAQRRLSDLHKGQAATAANTTAGKFGRLKLMMGEAGETIGSKLLPGGIKLADWFLKKGVPALTLFGNYLGQKLPPIFAKVKAVVSTVMGALRGDVGGNLAGIKQIFTDAVSIVQSLWKRFGGNIVQYLRASMANVKMVLSGAFEVVRGIFKTVSALLKGDWRGAWNGIKMIVRGAGRVVIGIVRQLGNLVRFAFKNLGVAAKAIFRSMWEGIKTLARNGATSLVAGIKGIPGRVKDAAGNFLSAGKTLGGKLLEGLRKGITGAVGVVGDIANAAFNKLKELVNKAIGAINGGIPNKLGKGKLSIDLPDNPIPKLARGGRVKAGQPYIVGDRGPRHAWELFTPGEDGYVQPRVPSAVGGSVARTSGVPSGGGMVVFENHFHVGVGDPVAIAKQVEKVMVAGQRALGRPFQFKTVTT